MSLFDLKAAARALGGEVKSGGVLAPGPGHSPADRSLSVRFDPEAPDGFIVHSFAGDDPIQCKDHVRSKIGLSPFKPNGGPKRPSEDAIARALAAAVNQSGSTKPKGVLVDTYDYTNENAELLFQVLRYVPKDFKQRRPNGNGGYIANLNGVRRVLYRWPELLAHPDATVFVCEGEKDADRVASLGHCATTVAAGKWTSECVKALAGRDVLVLEDNDKAGRDKALDAATLLHGVASTVRIVRLPGLGDRQDISDWLDADPRRAEKLVDVCFDAPLWGSDKADNADVEQTHTADEAADDAKPPERLILSSAEFVESFEAPDPLIESILMRKFIYALTGHVAKGKTAVALLCAAHVGFGRMLGNLEVEQGRVLYLAGENYVDVQMRWIAMAQQMDFDPKTIPVHFRPGRFLLSGKMEQLRREIEALGGVDLIIIDSSAAFFEGDDENSNAQAGVHARRLRELTKFKGEPCVLVLCHPPKNAGDDNLQPRGAGALIAEWDGNLTATKDGSVTTIHYQIKIRGPDFSPISFLLRNVTHERLKSKTGKLIPTVIAEPLSAEREEEMQKAARNEEDELMRAVNDHRRCNQAELARFLGWISRKGEPQRYRVSRIIKQLKKQKLVEEGRSGIELTSKGKATIKEKSK
jgi:hypothetical protein